MFKKNLTANSKSNQLGGKDAKNFAALIAKHFALDQLRDVEREKLLPKSVTKLSNKIVVYHGSSGDPLFFDPTGYADKILPTVSSNAVYIDLFL